MSDNGTILSHWIDLSFWPPNYKRGILSPKGGTSCPKLKESSESQQDTLFKALVAKNMILCGINNNRELAAKVHTGEKTFYLKIKESG
jgi:hypothetical protein